MDAFVLLTPLLVLAVVLLLGFTGCDLVFKLDPPTPSPLIMGARVPKEFTILQGLGPQGSRIAWLEPGATSITTAQALETQDQGSEFVLLFASVPDRPDGTWTVQCRVQVQEGSQQAQDEATATFTLTEDDVFATTAVFITFGRPSNNNFRVQFFGLVTTE